MATDTPPGRPRDFAPRYTVEGVDVAATLISQHSRRRAEDIRQNQRLEEVTSLAGGKPALPPTEATLAVARLGVILKGDATERVPERYVIPYYMPTRPNAPIGSRLLDVFTQGNYDQVATPGKSGKAQVALPIIRAGNPAGPLNDNMQRAVTQAFSTIEAQLPERFTFVRVKDAEKAIINFAAVPGMQYSAVTSPEAPDIILSARSYQGTYHAFMAHVAMHEIGHALGLEHPHMYQKIAASSSTEKATFFDTVMTYIENNKAQKSAAHAVAISLMPADLAALQQLYPVAGDTLRKTPSVAPAPVADRTPDFEVMLEQAGRTTKIPVAREGVTYYPVADTANDAVRITPMPAANSKGQLDVAKVTFEQSTFGLTIRSENGRGEVLIPIRAEQVVMEPSSDAKFLARNPTPKTR